ncbi:MAG TPA: SDR family NAD(P)-dependent oxidoreductase, partial [Umezawaea sp.]|nr:SDR family NAD(P)-dependent oxidoreductase [Umezawaea sp.]
YTDRQLEILREELKAALPDIGAETVPGLIPNIVVGRIANKLDLMGPSYTVDAACASSLVSIDHAVAALARGRCDAVLVGGVHHAHDPTLWSVFDRLGAMSGSGRIRPFDRSADGLLIGEGTGIVVLKRLSDARRADDRVYAVIRGVGSSSDGRAKSIYAPRAEGQVLALRRAYADADCSPASVQLFEAHATGTAVGDRTELQALTSVLREASDDHQYAAIGSVKSQIGHTKGAAGAASLMKLALSLYQKTLPPTINVERPNSAIAGPDSPVYLNTSTRPWIKDPNRPVRRAAASAMGFGGTNFHVVLEEHRSTREGTPVLHRTARAHLWHAPDPSALAELLRDGAPGADGGPVPEGHARLGFVAVDEETEARLRELAVRQLADNPDADQWSHPSGVFYRRSAATGVRVGALFAGQGSQYLEMGLDAALNNPVVAGAFDDVNAVFGAGSTSLADVVYPHPVFDAEVRRRQESALHRTEYAQPAIGALSVGQFRYLRDLGLTCSGFLGHSFGELTALWAAGSIDDDAFFRLACARGEAMAPPEGETDVDRGTMAAVQAGREEITALLADFADVQLCNDNAPDQVVVGGGTEAVAAFVAECGRRGLRARQLPVSAAFHTAHVAHAVDLFRPAVLDTRIVEPSAPVHANTAGAHYGSDVEANQRVLVDQLLRPVDFMDGLRAMRADGCTVFVEFGPKQVLTQLVRAVLPDAEVVAIPTDGGPLGDGDATLKLAAVRLAVLGLHITGINRHDAPAPEPRATGSMTIMLNGAEYVSDERKAAYRAAVEDGFVVSTTGAGLPAAAGVSTVAVPVAARDGNGAHPPVHLVAAEPDVLQQHLALHERYLDGQLRITEDLAAALRQQTVDGGDVGLLLRAVELVKEQSIGIGRTHVRANEVLAGLTALGGDVALLPPLTTDPAPVAPVEWIDFPVPASVSPPPQQTAQPPPVTPAVPVVPVEPTGPTSDSAREVLVTIVAERTGYPASMIDTTMDLEADLGVDSIKRVQILDAVQARIPGLPVLGPERLGEMRTLDDIVDFLMTAENTTAVVAPAPILPVEPTEVLAPAVVAPVVAAPAGLAPVDLVPLPAVDRLPGAFREAPVALLVERGTTDADAFEVALVGHGWTVHRTKLPAGPDTAEETGDLLAAALSSAAPLDLCLTVFEGGAHWDDGVDLLADAVAIAGYSVAPLSATARSGTRAAFVTVTRLDGGLGLRGTRPPAEAVVGGVGGVTKTLARERPELFCRAVDIDPELRAEAAADVLLSELHDAARDALEVGVDVDLTRWSLRPAPYGPTSWSPPTAPYEGSTDLTVGAADVVVVTGGARGVTAACVRELAARSGAEFVLLGRTELGAEPRWADGVADDALSGALAAAGAENGASPLRPREFGAAVRAVLAQREVRATLAAVAEAGSTVTYHSVDVGDPDAVREALSSCAARATVLVHGAGALSDALLQDKTPANVRSVLTPKLTGLRSALDALDGAPLRHVVLFTSVAGLLGNTGQADYAAANEALCRVAASMKRERPDRFVTAIDWCAWDGGMVGADLRALFEARGVELLGVDAGARLFVERFTAGRAGETRLIAGSPSALTGTPTPAPALAAVIRRELSGIEHTEVIKAHRIGAHPVMPATFGLGWLVNVLERAHPGLHVVECRSFEVHRGIVFDGDHAQEYVVETGPAEVEGGRLVVRAGLRGAVTGDALAPSHYAGTFVLSADVPSARTMPGWRDHPLGVGVEDALAWYAEGTIFHGPALQGLRRVLERSEGRLVLECRLPDEPVAAGAFAGARYSPVLTDLLLQGGAVLGSWRTGNAGLPLGVDRVEVFAPLPDDEPFVVVAEELRSTATSTTVNVTACDRVGTVLARLSEVSVIGTADMAAKFVDAVSAWRDSR